MDLQNLQALFSPGAPVPRYDDDDDDDDDTAEEYGTKFHVYPLGFLRTAGNVQATGPPHCIYPTLREINASVRKQPNETSDNDSPSEEYQPEASVAPVVKAISCQFYNLIAHRATPRAGRLDSQQGHVTAALASAFAQTEKDKKIAYEKQSACNSKLPSRSFHDKIHLDDCPKSCRAEIVYTVDVRNLKLTSGRHVNHPPHNASLTIQTGTSSTTLFYRSRKHGTNAKCEMQSKIILSS